MVSGTSLIPTPRSLGGHQKSPVAPTGISVPPLPQALRQLFKNIFFNAFSHASSQRHQVQCICKVISNLVYQITVSLQSFPLNSRTIYLKPDHALYYILAGEMKTPSIYFCLWACFHLLFSMGKHLLYMALFSSPSLSCELQFNHNLENISPLVVTQLPKSKHEAFNYLVEPFGADSPLESLLINQTTKLHIDYDGKHTRIISLFTLVSGGKNMLLIAPYSSILPK